jgi:Domain of unknown function (DUF4129)
MAQGSSIGGRMAEAAGRGLRLSLAVLCLAWGPSAGLTASAAQAQEAENAAAKAPDLEDLSRLPPELREPLARAYAPEDLQTVLPEDLKIEPIDMPQLWKPPEWLARIVEIMFWLLIGVGVLRRHQLKTGAVPMVQGSPLAADSQLLDALGRADRLAAEGQFAEALHLLLLHSIDYLRRHLGGVYGPSSTAREILQRARLPDTGRNSLGAIVDAAEVSYFGGRPVDGGMYAACRRHYQAFAFGGSPP